MDGEDARYFGVPTVIREAPFRPPGTQKRVGVGLALTRRTAPGREDPQPVGRAGQRVDRVLGVGHQAEHVAALVASPRRCRGPSRWSCGRRRSGRRPARSPRARRASPPARSSGLRRAWPGSRAARRLALSTSSTWWQRKRSSTLRSSAPGSSPASQRTWKPLQMPSTGAPPAAASATASIAGQKRAIAPARR